MFFERNFPKLRSKLFLKRRVFKKRVSMVLVKTMVFYSLVCKKKEPNLTSFRKRVWKIAFIEIF